MMTDDLHGVSKAIGKLEAENEEAERQRRAMFNKLDEIFREITKLTGAVEMLARDHSDTAKKVREDVMPTIDRIKNLEQRGMGVVAFVGVMAGGAGATALALFNKWTGVG